MGKIGINGFGRIGRYLTRLILMDDTIDLVLINDPASTDILAHLLKYDSVHGVLPLDVVVDGDLVCFSNGKKLKFSHEKDPSQIPWKLNEVKIVVDSSGLFLTTEKAAGHFQAGAERVILSAPANDESIPTVLLGVNDKEVLANDYRLLSNASCTTNNTAPLIAVIRELASIEYGYINTVHSYTNDQRLHDAPHKDFRRARAAANSIVPTSTGAAKAITRVFPDLKGKLTGGSVRVPVPNGSISEITLVLDKELSVEEINAAMKTAAEGKLKGILGYTSDPIVSTDIIGNPLSCLFDSGLTVSIGKMVKIAGWYDNEAGYSNRLFDLVKKF
ncbi:MAG: type glyceraldehyde-3-phosphate dehydrogenase [Bacteroidota bacterium]|jgi:glyceraldehyde 3-phosphate dehydrogenase